MKSMGHSFCRGHSDCSARYKDAKIWNPSSCDVCKDVLEKINSMGSSLPEAEKALISAIKEWAAGFQRLNTPTEGEGGFKVPQPYLASEDLRARFFPRAGKESVAPWTDQDPVDPEVERVPRRGHRTYGCT